MTDTPATYFANPAFREYVFLLVELQRLFRHGHGQSPQADAIREEMDFPMHRFDAGELDALKDFGKHLTAMSEKYGSMLDREVTETTSAEKGIAPMPMASHSPTTTELSR
jgi:hypothetical protein